MAAIKPIKGDANFFSADSVRLFLFSFSEQARWITFTAESIIQLAAHMKTQRLAWSQGSCDETG